MIENTNKSGNVCCASSFPEWYSSDYNNEAITGTFYQPELQKVDVRDEDTFKIEKILKTRGRGPNKQYFLNGEIGQRNSILG